MALRAPPVSLRMAKLTKKQRKELRRIRKDIKLLKSHDRTAAALVSDLLAVVLRMVRRKEKEMPHDTRERTHHHLTALKNRVGLPQAQNWRRRINRISHVLDG